MDYTDFWQRSTLGDEDCFLAEGLADLVTLPTPSLAKCVAGYEYEDAEGFEWIFLSSLATDVSP